MAVFLDLGIYSEAEANALRNVAREVIGMVKQRQPPFDDSWVDWRPEPGLALGDIPEGWQYLPVPAPYRTYDLSEGRTARIEASKRLYRG
jgi:hypothetical protein